MTNFKKIIASVSAAVTMLTAVSAAGITASASNFPGDLDDDNKITVVDITLMKRYLYGTLKDINRRNADINSDNQINIFDLIRLQNMYDESPRSEISCTVGHDGILNAGQRLTSPNGNYYAILQSDGKLMVYCTKYGKNVAVWGTNKLHSEVGYENVHLALQYDGNLVVYNSVRKALWASDTSCKPHDNYKLSIDNDGILRIIRTRNDEEIWHSEEKNEAREAQIRIKSQYEYSSIDDAARDFVVAYNGLSFEQNREYGSTINKVGENRYSFKHVCWGAVRTDENGNCGNHFISWDNSEAYVHTHGQATDPDNLVFSKIDLDLVNKKDDEGKDRPYKYAYLGNPNGKIYKFTKGKNSDDYSGITELEKSNTKKYRVTYQDPDVISRQDSGDGIFVFC